MTVARPHRLRVILITLAGALALAASAVALNIADTIPPRGKVGEPYTWTLTTEPGSGTTPLTWIVPHSGVFPPGLTASTSEDTRTLTISGRPSRAGIYRFFVQLRDAPGPWVCCTEEEFEITIDPADQPPPPPPPPPPPASAFPITVIAQDATTITLSWPRQTADGYVFYFGGQERSRTRDPKRVTVRVSKGWPEYRVCPGDLVTGQRPCGVYRP